MRTKQRRTHYEILGVKQTADEEEIKQGYRRRVKRVHPDRNPDDPRAPAKFKRVTEAYEVLSDPGRRRAYDRTLPGNDNFRDRPADRPRRPDPPPEDIPRPGPRTKQQWRKLYEDALRKTKAAEREGARRAHVAWNEGFNDGVRHAEKTEAAKKEEIKRKTRFLYTLHAALLATAIAGVMVIIHPSGLLSAGLTLLILSLSGSVIVFTYIAQLSRK